MLRDLYGEWPVVEECHLQHADIDVISSLFSFATDAVLRFDASIKDVCLLRSFPPLSPEGVFP